MYHEKQSLFRCGIHALNNLLQAPVFSKETFDQACMTLHQLSGGNHTILASFWNAHEAPLGLGNYDVNVLMYVLQEKGKTY
jgi:josephin